MRKLLLILLMVVSCCEAANRVVIYKSRHLLIVIPEIDKTAVIDSTTELNIDTLFQAYIACGSNKGNKTAKGDRRTPTGTFPVIMVQNSQKWKYNPNNGKPLQAGVYGPIFFRLGVPKFWGIGIHGTNNDKSIGTNASGGCIRMHNADVLKLREFVDVGTLVTIIE